MRFVAISGANRNGIVKQFEAGIQTGRIQRLEIVL
jgi:hypothetical protein